MMEICYFTCPQKGKMAAVYFTQKEELEQEIFDQLLNSDVDRYIELILRKEGKEVIQAILKDELNSPSIINEIIDTMFKDNELEEIA